MLGFSRGEVVDLHVLDNLARDFSQHLATRGTLRASYYLAWDDGAVRCEQRGANKFCHSLVRGVEEQGVYIT